MEWLRSCYSSKWRLFRNSDALTDGFYYFSPEGTPHYPGLHLYGSRNWNDHEEASGESKGEWRGPQQWRNGAAPSALPLAIRVGSAECIEYGEADPATELPPGALSNCHQFPPGCFSITEVGESTYDIYCCVHQHLLLGVVARLYLDPLEARLQAQDLLGDEYLVTTHIPDNPLLPPAIAAIGPSVFLFVVGTQTANQGGLQAIQGAAPLPGSSTFSTITLWSEAANHLLGILALIGATPDKVVYLIGHSYGAAALSVAAGRMRLSGTGWNMRLLTAGCPYPGDERLPVILADVVQNHLCAVGDPVCGMPPRRTSIPALAAWITGGRLELWNQLEPNRNRRFLDAQGNSVDADDADLDWEIVQTIAEAIDAGDPLEGFRAHFLSEYITRIKWGCPDPLPPLDGRPPILALRWTSFDWVIGVTEIHIGELYAFLTDDGLVWDSGELGPGDGYSGLRIFAGAIGPDETFVVPPPFPGMVLNIRIDLEGGAGFRNIDYVIPSYVFWTEEVTFIEAMPRVDFAPPGENPEDPFAWAIAVKGVDMSVSLPGAAPTGPAGGVLSGEYPNPGFAVDMATQAELDAAIAILLAGIASATASGENAGRQSIFLGL